MSKKLLIIYLHLCIVIHNLTEVSTMIEEASVRVLFVWSDASGPLNPDAVLKYLRPLSVTLIVPAKGRTAEHTKVVNIAATYPSSFTQCQKGQQEKVVSFWHMLEKSVQETVLLQARAYEKESVVDTKNANLTPSEMGRIGKLENSVVAAAAWAQIRRPLNREELDKRQLGDTSSKKEVCPWSTLHEIFSDPDLNSPFNLECTNDAVCHTSGGVRVLPLIQAEDGPLGSYSQIFERIKDIDPRIILPGRTVEWLKTNIQKFESTCNRISQKFNASGGYEGENLYKIWSDFCNGEASWTLFIPLCLDPTEMNVFSKVMSEGMGMDTGILGDNVIKKKQQSAARSKKYRESSRSTFPIDEARSWNRLPSLGFRNMCLFLRLTTHCNWYMHPNRTALGSREADRNSSICL